MSETFAQYLDRWLKQSTRHGLNNPLVKMPVKRFRVLQPAELQSLTNGGTLAIGTTSDPIARNLYKNFQTRIRERGEHSGFICHGSIEMIIAGAVGQQPRAALFPVCLKRAALQTTGDKVKVSVSEEDAWQLNPVLQAHLKGFGVSVPVGLAEIPPEAVEWIRAQLGNRASAVKDDSYVGLFSSQQMVVQARLTEPSLRKALAHNAVVQAKIEGTKVSTVDLGETTDEGIEELGLLLPCDDSQLRVVQLSDEGCCLQVEGPPGTGKSQTIANIISNALYHGRNALLVCDKRAAIVQVEERLSGCGLRPALLNLHDEDLDKREFLRQATDKFPPGQSTQAYPFAQLKETRKTLNDRVRFGRALSHPSMQVAKRDAIAGLINLRKELKSVPNIDIPNWQSLSRERLAKLLGFVAGWPDLAGVLIDTENIWNKVCPEAFDDNPNAANELKDLLSRIQGEIEKLDEAREWMAAVGIETALASDDHASQVLMLTESVLNKPSCHPKLVGNRDLRLEELEHLKSVWARREELVGARHPLPLCDIYPAEVEQHAADLLSLERATSWNDLSARELYYAQRKAEVLASQNQYLRLCGQVGLVYSPLLKVRRAQFQAVLSLGGFGTSVPRSWWNANAAPVLSIASWKAHLQACADQAKSAPLPMHFTALDRIAETHWKHIEAKAEHGFNLVSYCLHYVSDRKCKYALRQIFPTIPRRRFKQWEEVTLHAVAARSTVGVLRAVSETHVALKQLTSAYLALAHEDTGHVDSYLTLESVQTLEKVAASVEQMRARNDLFEIDSVHWQTFWEFPNASLLSLVHDLVSELGRLALPDPESDNVEDAIESYEQSGERIQKFLRTFETEEGNRSNAVLAAFAAQKEYAHCQNELAALTVYLDLQPSTKHQPDWAWLHDGIEWRDRFEELCGSQKLDVDSALWLKIANRLRSHRAAMEGAYQEIESYFRGATANLPDYEALLHLASEILNDLARHPLWLEKRRWQARITAFPEIQALWKKTLEGSVKPEHAERLFCFNLLRLCEPLPPPHGAELKQTLKSFSDQDDKLGSWIVEKLKASLRKVVQEAGLRLSHSESELRRLLGLQRIRGTVRELVNANLEYLIAAKRCWMISPTSLANLIDSRIFEEIGVPFDLIIFDEASQIRVLDGLLSMSFGRQVIIVGDKHQLPPTDFFAGFAQVEPDQELEDFGVSESLLDEFGGVFDEEQTQVMLMSHYRSETPDLIRFSNDWFYSKTSGVVGTGLLEMYPPAHVAGVGRRFHYVPNAVYSETGQRNNRIEAEEVAKLIELHVRECPEKSLGVVTMNIPQMELIDEKLQFFTSETVRAFCADESKFFLRNLETVQGDEMDRIILSLTYGKNASGSFNASVLGPLIKSGGERRLNVAITRSRNGLTVVSSLKAADLESSSAQSKGFRCLKAFLMDLETTQLSRTFGIGSERFKRRRDGISNIVYCESPFEEQVVEFLENEGYEIECQYGAGKFRIDIVVKERGRNLLGIECDGAAYHNSLVARTRDRARQRLLERELGWRIHRVWSTNWWFFEQAEKEAIIVAINSARAAVSPSVQRRQ